jgi:hypothetical protein
VVTPIADGETPQKSEPQIGQQVLVFYDPADPNTNALTDFAELGTRSLDPAPLLLFGIGAVAFLIVRRRRMSLRATEGEIRN